MKKLRILWLFALVLLLAGCKGRGFEDVRVTSVRLVSISPEGLTRISAVAEVGVHNPTVAFDVTNLDGLAKFLGQDALMVTGEPVSIAARCDSVYTVPLQGRMAEGFNPLRLLRLLGDDASFDDITFDVRARVTLRSGLGKNIEMLDIPLSGLLSGTVLENHDNTTE